MIAKAIGSHVYNSQNKIPEKGGKKWLKDIFAFGGLGLAAAGVGLLFGWPWAMVLVGVTFFYLAVWH